MLAALEHSSVPDVRNLASATLNVQAAADARAATAVSNERAMQERISALVSEIRVSFTVPLALEEALRMVPRSAFLPQEQVNDLFPTCVTSAHIDSKLSLGSKYRAQDNRIFSVPPAFTTMSQTIGQLSDSSALK